MQILSESEHLIITALHAWLPALHVFKHIWSNQRFCPQDSRKPVLQGESGSSRGGHSPGVHAGVGVLDAFASQTRLYNEVAS